MTIIDVREPEEFNEAHVKGAINIPPSKLLLGEISELKDLPSDEQLIVYCRSGARSVSSIPYLQRMGFTNITNGVNQFVTESLLKKNKHAKD